jgi:hypothetical protein
MTIVPDRNPKDQKQGSHSEPHSKNMPSDRHTDREDRESEKSSGSRVHEPDVRSGERGSKS